MGRKERKRANERMEREKKEDENLIRRINQAEITSNERGLSFQKNSRNGKKEVPLFQLQL
jgi:hypothetical protein